VDIIHLSLDVTPDFQKRTVKGEVVFTFNPVGSPLEELRLDACRGAHLVTTDVWTSMGFEAENAVRMQAFADWCVDREMMAAAQPDALFMHCLPAHRGEEVEADVIDGPQSVVWDEAENRMHVQKALMEYLVLGRIG
jgi:ornithine carbamoyltransferase